MESLQQILYVILLAMAPISECRGSIIYGYLVGMDLWVVFFASLFGNIIFIPFVLLLLETFDRWVLALKDTHRFKRLYVRYIVYVRNKYKPQIDRYGYLGLTLFVAVPVPLTGAWTGSLLAYLLGMEYKKAVLWLALGVLGACIIVTTVVYGFGYLFTGL